MARLRRFILSKQVYEVCFRTKEGLPFVCTQYMRLILESVIARAQRDFKVDISHLIYMGNHPHMLISSRDAEQFKNFYCEVKKQTTEMVKRLLGKRHLSLWQENATNVVYLEDLETIQERIAYFYSNPSKAGLVNTIDNYPGLSTWEVFLGSENSINYEYKKNCPWIQQPMLKPLPCKSVTERQDRAICSELIAKSEISHQLVIMPNVWMSAFVEDNDPDTVRGYNQQIIKLIRENEASYRQERNEACRRTLGSTALKQAPIDRKYTPKKFSPAVFVITRNNELRKQIIAWYREFCNQCAECYQQWKAGNLFCQWPPGAYAPVGCPGVNVLQIDI